MESPIVNQGKDKDQYGSLDINRDQSHSVSTKIIQSDKDQVQDKANKDPLYFWSLCLYCNGPYPVAPLVTLKELCQVLDAISASNLLSGISEYPNPFY